MAYSVYFSICNVKDILAKISSFWIHEIHGFRKSYLDKYLYKTKFIRQIISFNDFSMFCQIQILWIWSFSVTKHNATHLINYKAPQYFFLVSRFSKKQFQNCRRKASKFFCLIYSFLLLFFLSTNGVYFTHIRKYKKYFHFKRGCWDGSVNKRHLSPSLSPWL